MALSKRLRFEILRRDNHTCQYCGEKAPDVTLHVDHVKPKALGGGDGPDNLVAACKDCNAGKASTILGSEHTQGIADRNIRWEQEAQVRSAKIRGTLERDQQYLADFEEEWHNVAKSTGGMAAWPTGYEASIYKWAGMGYPYEALELAISVAYGATRVHETDRFVYLAGIVWNQIKEAQVELYEIEPLRLYTEDEYIDAYMKGCDWGEQVGHDKAAEDAPKLYTYWNPLSLVVDGLCGTKIESMRWYPDGSHPLNQT